MADQPLDRALLPAGLADGLPPFAEQEARAIERLTAEFAAEGYQRVKPPLVEFEDSLLTGPGAALAPQMFRLMDPVSQRMMGVRADFTPQIARIAWSRLGNAPRPLRLCYAGQVLRVRGGQVRPERQFAQVGLELIGAEAMAADLEVLLLAAGALGAVGIAGLSVDLVQPTLVPAICRGHGLTVEATAEARAALDQKDGGRLARIGGRAGDVLRTLLEAAGPADRARATLAKLDLPAEATSDRDRLVRMIELTRSAAPDLALTVDPGEYRGFEYETGIAFAFFAKGLAAELGRGGRYRLAGGETATGATLYMDSVLKALPAPAAARCVYLPAGTPRRQAVELRRQGWRTVAGFEPGDAAAEARRLGCSHVWDGSAAREVGHG
ncbi:MAG: ATP phosphoribosyltransferase regulatory subunit [Alphaproteobacteria bacterium]|nr:ATP phosphoribosyltransferase regulatory subunit [Alphaproteobacteria bacterium]